MSLYTSLITSLLSGLLFAPAPRITAELSESEAFLGDAVRLSIVMEHEEGWQVARIEFPEDWSHIRILDQQWREVPGSESAVTELSAQLAFFALGEQEIPGLSLELIGPNGERTPFNTPGLTIEIKNMLAENDQEMAPLKDHIDLPYRPILLWILAGLILLVLIVFFIVYKFLRARPEAIEPELPPPPPADEALARLQALTNGTLLKEGKVKEFYVEINGIIRHYYGRIFSIPAEEMTSFELEDFFEAKRRSLPDGFRDVNNDFQGRCDQVKFAKYDPVEAETKQLVNQAYQIVRDLRPLVEEVDHVALG